MKQLLPTLVKALPYLLEVLAVAAIAVVVAVVAAPIWALIPVAVYLVIAAQVLGRGSGGQGAR